MQRIDLYLVRGTNNQWFRLNFKNLKINYFYFRTSHKKQKRKKGIECQLKIQETRKNNIFAKYKIKIQN
jgi:hypothetical protein